MQGVVRQLIIGDLAAAQIGDDPGRGVVGGAGDGIVAAGVVVSGTVRVRGRVGVHILAGLVRFLRPVRLVRLVRLIRLVRFVGFIGLLRFVRPIRFVGLVRGSLGLLSLTLGVDGVGVGLGQRGGVIGPQTAAGQGRRQHQGCRQYQQHGPQKMVFQLFHGRPPGEIKNGVILLSQNNTITVSGNYSCAHSRSPDSYLKRRSALPSQKRRFQ